MFPPEAYIFHTQTLFPYLRDTTLSPLISYRVALSSSPSRTSARTEIGRAGLRNPTPCIETPARVLRAIRFLGSVFRDCSPASSTLSSSWWTSDSDRLLRLLPGGRSRDCTANIFLHRLWSASSRNALCRLVRMEPPVPSALVPPLGTILNDCFSFSVCLLLLQ